MKKIPGTNKRTQILLGFLLVWMGCSSPRDIIIISGQTMGTTYSIKIIHVGLFEAQKKIEQGIDSILTEVNRKMSTWDPNSEISQFNLTHSTEPYAISESFRTVVKAALDVSEKTDGFFDITVFER